MKNLKSKIALIVFIFCLNIISEAQERKISEQEMTELRSKSSLVNRSYRLRRFSESFTKKDGKMSFYSDETTKYAANGDFHSIIKSGRTKENITRTEIIKIGDRTYELMFDGKWIESTTICQLLFFPGLLTDDDRRESTLKIKTFSNHFYKGKVTFDNQEFDLYESKIETFDKKSRNISTVVQKNWFDRDGLLVKTEERLKGKFGLSNRLFEITLDVNIKIEAPVK
jgi:hypothetical protein